MLKIVLGGNYVGTSHLIKHKELFSSYEVLNLNCLWSLKAVLFVKMKLARYLVRAIGVFPAYLVLDVSERRRSEPQVIT